MQAAQKTRRVAVVAAIGLLMLGPMACVSTAAKQKTLPANGKLKVFILAGQSNMEGQGIIGRTKNAEGAPGRGTLEAMVKNPAAKGRYDHLYDKDGNWAVRDDVWITFNGGRTRALTVGGFAAGGCIGPELAFGQLVGDYLDDKVLLIKFGYGGTSLIGPWRPPSSGGTVGGCYSGMIKAIKARLENLAKDVPDYDGKGYEIVGFGWHQGWNDGCGAGSVMEYGGHLANFIRDVRKDLGVLDLPFVIGGSGFGGWKQRHTRRLGIMKAQESVAQLEEFKGTVRYLETRGFFRPGSESPRPLVYHWCYNGESFYLIGEGMGRIMVDMLGGPKAPPNQKNPLPPEEKPTPTVAITIIKLEELTLDLRDKVTMKLVKIPAGTFMMGSPEDEPGRSPAEGPRHKVKIDKPFFMGIYEVTVAQFRQFVKDTGDGRDLTKCRKDHPITNVGGADCAAFCEWLSKKSGRKVGLPTEAQWEYACRAGRDARFYYGDDPADLNQYAHFDFDRWDGSKMDSPFFAPVGQFKPNSFGLYDMHGNVAELCSDVYRASYKEPSVKAEPDERSRVVRGGYWRAQPDYCRSASRSRPKHVGHRYHGFRVIVED